MGILVLFIGLAVLGFGLSQHLKGKRILAAPYKKTGELAKNPVSPDPKGAMSTEGKVLAPAQELLSPCTKQPCLYYEVKIERLYEKTETTQDGTKTVKGSDTLDTLKGGAICGLDDGTGAMLVDFAKGADFDNMKDGLKKELNGGGNSSNVRFGELNYDVPVLSGKEGWTTGFKVTEKYVPVAGELFVLGKLEGGKLVKPSWRSMLASSKGREGLLGSVNKRKKFSFIGGGVATALAIPLMIFGPKADPNATSAYCEHTLTDARAKCSATVSAKSGDSYSWHVTQPGKYDLSVIAPAKKISFYPQLMIENGTGEVVADVSGGVGEAAKATVDVKAGDYKLTVKPADGYMVKGGFSYDMQIISQNPKAAAKGDAVAANGAAIKGTEQKLEKQGLTWVLPEGLELVTNVDVLDSSTLALSNGAAVQVSPVKADSLFAAKSLEEAKKATKDYEKSKITSEGNTADGWKVAYQHESGLGTMYSVTVRRTLDGKAFDCESTSAESQDSANVGATVCDSLKGKGVPGKLTAAAAPAKAVKPAKAVAKPAAKGGKKSNKMAR